jgi:hypothetical protein
MEGKTYIGALRRRLPLLPRSIDRSIEDWINHTKRMDQTKEEAEYVTITGSLTKICRNPRKFEG